MVQRWTLNEISNELWDYVKSWEFLDQLMDFWCIESAIQSFNYSARHGNISYFNRNQEEEKYVFFIKKIPEDNNIFLHIFSLVKKTVSNNGVKHRIIGL